MRRVRSERGGLWISGLFFVVIVANLAALWRVAVRGQGGELDGYSASALSWYIAMSEVGTVAVGGRQLEDTGTAIGDGTIAVELLRPAPPVIVRLGLEWGRALPQAAMLGVIGCLVCVVTVGAPPSLATMPLVVVALALGVSVNVATQHLFAASAFWLRDAGTAWFIYQKFVLVVGGVLLPLELLPGWLRSTANVLPFRAIGYASGRLAAGFFEPWLLAQQLAWLVGMTVAASVVFAVGERRLQVLGG